MSGAYAGLSTHVLDTARGEPAAGVPVRLYREGELAAEGVTDHDGRWRPGVATPPGRYRIVFDIAARLGPDAFFPEGVIVFRVGAADRNYHVPLLLSPFGLTTYRGS